MENSMSITTILERERELDDLVKVCLDELEVIDILDRFTQFLFPT